MTRRCANGPLYTGCPQTTARPSRNTCKRNVKNPEVRSSHWSISWPAYLLHIDPLYTPSLTSPIIIPLMDPVCKTQPCLVAGSSVPIRFRSRQPVIGAPDTRTTEQHTHTHAPTHTCRYEADRVPTKRAADRAARAAAVVHGQCRIRAKRIQTSPTVYRATRVPGVPIVY